MANNDDRIAQIDAKLTALLSLILDGYLRETKIAKPKARSIDRMLADAGLSAKTISGLLGKTERAVNLHLQKDAKPKSKPKKKARP